MPALYPEKFPTDANGLTKNLEPAPLKQASKKKKIGHAWSVHFVYAITFSLLLGSLAAPSPAVATVTPGGVDLNAQESAPISGPNNPHTWSYSFSPRWNAEENRAQYLGVAMPTSLNGMVNIAEIDTDMNRRGNADTSKNIIAREVFSDGLERSGQSSLTLAESLRVLIGTTRGELVDVDPDTFSTTRIDVPAGTASMLLSLAEAGPNVLIGTRAGSYPGGNGEVLSLKYACTYTQCSDAERWTRYGAPVPGNELAYGANSWRGAVIAGSGDKRAVLSVYQGGQWSELASIAATASNSRERFSQARVIGDYLYASYDGSNQDKNGTHVYRLGQDNDGRITATWVNVIRRWVISPMPPQTGYSQSSIIYRGFSDSLMIYDPEKGTSGTTTTFGNFPAAQMPERTKTGGLPTSSCWVVEGKICATWRPDGAVVLAAKAEGSTPETLKRISATSASGATILDGGRREIGRLAIGPERTKIYASSSFFGHLIRQIDTQNAATKDLPLRSYLDSADSVTQVESVGSVGNKLVLGTYAEGAVSQIDPAQPISCENSIDRETEQCNPSLSSADRTVGLSQVRPVSIADLGTGKAALASYGMSGHITGALTFYDTASKKITDRALLQDASGIKLSEMGLASVASRELNTTGGWVYAGTNARPPNNKGAQTQAAIIRYNINTKETQALSVPYGIVNDVQFGADGRLYAMAGFNFITIEPGLGDKPFAIVNITRIGNKRGFGGVLTPLSDGTFAVLSGGWENGADGELHLVDPRGGGLPKSTFLGKSAVGQLVVVNAPSGRGSRWFYTRGPSVYFIDQPTLAGPLR